MSKMTVSSPAINSIQEERSNAQFPWKLHELLSQAEKNGNDAIISWLPGTDAFKVHNKQKFATEILPAYFNATKYKSFQRNLNLWGFETISEGPNKGGCYHKLFLRDDREKCHYMTRQKVKGNKPPAKQDSPPLPPKSPESELARNSGPLSALAGLASAAQVQSTAANQQTESMAQPLRSASLASSAGGAATSDLKQKSFPLKLHHFLSQPDFEDCVTWTSDGRCIRIVDPFRFQEKVAPIYFSHSSFSSFLVELESYGFKKVTHAGFHECYYHDMIIKGCQHLCKYVSTPSASKRFVSDDPQRDLTLDPPMLRPLEANNIVDRQAGALSSNLSHLAGLLPSLQASELSRLQQQHHLQEQQRQAIAGLDPLIQFIQGGHSLEPSAAQTLSQLRASLTPSFLGGSTRSPSLPAQSVSSLLPSSSAVDTNQNRSAIAAFLSNTRSSAEDVFSRAAGSSVGSSRPS